MISLLSAVQYPHSIEEECGFRLAYMDVLPMDVWAAVADALASEFGAGTALARLECTYQA